MKGNKKVLWLAEGAMIAALYAVLTILQNVLLPGSASMAVQFRVSEVLTILSLYTSAAIPGLTIGCIIANLSSLASLGAYDLIFGSLASLCAAVAMYLLRRVRVFRLPVLAALMNGIFVGPVSGRLGCLGRAGGAVCARLAAEPPARKEAVQDFQILESSIRKGPAQLETER